MRIAIVQKVISGYRQEFFKELTKKNDLSIFTYHDPAKGDVSEVEGAKCKRIKKLQWKSFFYVRMWPLLLGHFDILVLQWHQGHISTWILLLTKWLHRRKIILWGQGISVQRYLKEEKKPNILLRWMMKMANGGWIYMDKEYDQWHTILPKKPMVALKNSLSGLDEMLEYKPDITKELMKAKYNITQERIFIFCARFIHNNRRTDLLEEIIHKLDRQDNGFIIIGDGPFKPDFTKYTNVYEFGALYVNAVKRELFSIADLYLQPGWVGLSIVEAMAYGKPVCTFVRSAQTLQCVEYDYIKDGDNGMIFKDVNDAITRLSNLSDEGIAQMSERARQTAEDSSPKHMAERACSVLDNI